MTHIVSRSLGVAALSVMSLALGAIPAHAQSRPVPPAVARRDTVALLAPTRTPPPSTVRPTNVAGRLRTPTPPAPLLAKAKPTPAPIDSQVVSASVAAPAPTVPPPLARDVPVAPGSRASATAATRNVSVSAARPANATGRCKDGTYLTSAATDQACSSHEGLAVSFAAPRQPPRRQ